MTSVQNRRLSCRRLGLGVVSISILILAIELHSAENYVYTEWVHSGGGGQLNFKLIHCPLFLVEYDRCRAHGSPIGA